MTAKVASLSDGPERVGETTAGASRPDAHEANCKAYFRGGVCTLVGGSVALALVRVGDRIAGPPVFVRKGFRMVTSPAIFFPSAVQSDYGDAIGAGDAANWIGRSGMGHPRAEAQGVLEDGASAACLLRDLDLSEPCFWFAAEQAHEFPGAVVVADLRGDSAGTEQLGEFPNSDAAVAVADQTNVMDKVERLFAGRRIA